VNAGVPERSRASLGRASSFGAQLEGRARQRRACACELCLVHGPAQCSAMHWEDLARARERLCAALLRRPRSPFPLTVSPARIQSHRRGEGELVLACASSHEPTRSHRRTSRRAAFVLWPGRRTILKGVPAGGDS